MSVNCFIVLALIFKIEDVSGTLYGSTTLENSLSLTTDYFEQLKRDYEFESTSPDLMNKLDEQITWFVQNVKSSVFVRQKRHLEGRNEYDEAINVLDGFSDLPGFNLSNALDVCFFVRKNGEELEWFTAVLDLAEVSLNRWNGNSFVRVGSYDLINGTDVTADSLESNVILVVKRSDGSVVVLRSHERDGKVYLHPAQHLYTPGVSYLSLWGGMNQLYLGIASKSNLSIYHWLGEHFDFIQALNVAGKKLTPFQTGGSMYLAVTGSQTVILKFVLQSNEFVVTQRLPASKDTTVFFTEKGHMKRHYLGSSNERSTVLYKQTRDRFVPFQRIAASDEIVSFSVTKEALLLFLLRNGELNVYQYDGWRFVELDVKLSAVRKARPTPFYGEAWLAVLDEAGAWRLTKPIWTQRNMWRNLKNGMKAWCRETKHALEATRPLVPKAKDTVRILNGNIGKLNVRNIVNARLTNDLTGLTHRCEDAASILSAKVKALSHLMSTKDPTFATLRASKIRVKCEARCRIAHLVTLEGREFLDEFARAQNQQLNLHFRNVRVDSAEGSQCPVPAVELQETTVGGYVNGVDFEALQEHALRVSGDQEVTADHIFANLSAIGAYIPLGIASQATQQKVYARSVEAKAVNLTQGGILLPTNGSSTVMSGSIVASKARIRGPINLRGRLKGDGVSGLKPLTYIPGHLELTGDYTLRDVNVRNSSRVKDLVRSEGKSLNEIIAGAVPLNGDVPVHLRLSSDKVVWTNVTLQSFPSCVTTNKRTDFATNVTGLKYVPHSITLAEAAYNKLPDPVLSKKLCGDTAIIPNIKTPTLTVYQASANVIKSEELLGANELSELLADSATSVSDLNLVAKRFSGNVKISNVLSRNVSNVDFGELRSLADKWTAPDILKGPIIVTNLSVHHLQMSNHFQASLPLEVDNVMSKGNTYLGHLNDINVIDFLKSVVTVNETLSLTNITFADGLSVIDKIHASQTSIPFPKVKNVTNVRSKKVFGSLKVDDLILPSDFMYAPTETQTNYIIKGSATFAREPIVSAINNQNLKQLCSDVWMANDPTILSNKLLEIRNLTLRGSVDLIGSLSTPHLGSWTEISERLLSKSKPQEIDVPAAFHRVYAPNVIGSEISALRAPVSFLDGLGYNSLKRNGEQVIKASLHFEELVVPGDLNLYGIINGMNLSIDVVRHNALENIVTGKKTVTYLEAINVNGLKFDEWSRNTLRTKNSRKQVTIKGHKTFKNMKIQELNVTGTVKGYRVENLLRKSIAQEIVGLKNFRGTVRAPAIVIDGRINDVDLTSLTEYQLKKSKDLQRIQTLVVLRNGLQVVGNVTIDGLYDGVELKNFNKINESLEPVDRRMTELEEAAEVIDVTLRNRAIYWDKLELLEENSIPLILDPFRIDGETSDRCEIVNRSVTCCGNELRSSKLISNEDQFILNKVVTLAGKPVVVLASSAPRGGIWIYSLDSLKGIYEQVAGLHIPDAVRASLFATAERLWIVVQLLSKIMILRYEPWGEFQRHVLPGFDSSLATIAPTGELLLFRSDGVWSLEGIAGPHRIFDAPLHGKIDTFVLGFDCYVQLTQGNTTTLLKTRYVGY